MLVSCPSPRMRGVSTSKHANSAYEIRTAHACECGDPYPLVIALCVCVYIITPESEMLFGGWGAGQSPFATYAWGVAN